MDSEVKRMKREFEGIINRAANLGIEVRIAKKQSDVEIEGIHVMEPDIEGLLDALMTAIDRGLSIVMVHSKIGWPYARLSDEA